MEVTIIDVYVGILDGKFKRFPNETWNPHKMGYDNFLRCIKYLFEKLNLSRDDLKVITKSFFTKYKLRGALQELFNDSPYQAIRF
ncbi:hypothetical protein D3C74_322590 [compost metagenome]